jgi:hypothetical protein
MTSRSTIRILLSLLLLMSQQMAIVHAMSHWTGRLAPAARVVQHQDGDADKLSKAFAQDQTCEKCLAFAQLASALGNTARPFAPPHAGSVAIAATADHTACARTICVFDPRAPPAAA